MTESPQRVLQTLVYLFSAIPPLALVLVILVLAGLTLWSAGAALHSYRLLDALANAPLADLRSHASGLIKLRGTAQPPPAPPGFSPSETIWHKKRSWRSGSSTTVITVGHFLIRDEHGVCAVDSEKAEIVATTSESNHAFLDSSRGVSEESIRAGDPVTAIGELRRDLPAPSDMSDIRCQLARANGVLLVSGSPERQVRVLYRIWLTMQLSLALLGAFILTPGILVQIANQTGTSDNAAGRILERLLNTEHLEPTQEEAERKLLAISAPFGLQLTAPPVGDYAAHGWVHVEIAGTSLFVPPGWVEVERDDSGPFPSVGLVAPGNDAYIELRLLPDVLRRPGIALEEAIDNYTSAKNRAEQGVVLGYAPLGVDGAVGHIEIMNSGGSAQTPDGSLTHRNNSYRGARRFGETVIRLELTATFAQADQDKFGPMALNVMRSIRLNSAPATEPPGASDAGTPP